MSSDFTVVSYGTADRYQGYLERLGGYCREHRLRHDLVLQPKMRRLAAYLMKPTFILEKLREHGTIVWLDADTTILTPFSLPEGDWDVGTVPNTNTKSLKKNPTCTFVLAFRPTPGSETLLGLWKYLCDWPALSVKRQDHKRFTWARMISEGRHEEIDLSASLSGSLIRDIGTWKEAAL